MKNNYNVDSVNVNLDKSINLSLKDGRVFTLQLNNYPLFENLSEKQIMNYKVSKTGIIWADVNETLSYAALLRLCGEKVTGQVFKKDGR